jgi:hypothetical protein
MADSNHEVQLTNPRITGFVSDIAPSEGVNSSSTVCPGDKD